MATNPFLQSPFDTLADELNGQAVAPLPGQEAVKPQEAPTVEAAPPSTAAPAPAVAPETRRPSKAAGYLPPETMRPMFDSASQKHDVPVNVLMALAHQESRYNSGAVGTPTEWGRAKGMLQYLDSTAGGMGINAFDPEQSVDAAAKQIRQRLDKGYSMEDAVKEHFAGPNRKLWGAKTKVYGEEVIGKAYKIGEMLMGGATGTTEAKPATGPASPAANGIPKDWIEITPEQADAYEQKISNNMSQAMPRGVYEQAFRANNPQAPQAAVDMAMREFDTIRPAAGQVPMPKAGFTQIPSPSEFFNKRLDKRLAGPANGIVPQLPGRISQIKPAAFDVEAAKRESKLSAAGSQLGKSLKAGMYDLAGGAATVLDAVNPWTTTRADAAVLFKDDPAGLERMQKESLAMGLSRFAEAMTKNAEEAMAETSPGAKLRYDGLKYATTDVERAAYLSPVKVIGDAVRSLPSSLAMAASVYFTRGAAAQAEASALAAGLSPELARQAAIAAGAKAMGTAGAVSEGAVGYGLGVNNSQLEASKVSNEVMEKSPRYAELLTKGFTPETARAKIIADTAQQAGQIAGIVDAAVNKVGGAMLGKILTEGGKFLPRVFKGAGAEGATEFVQSAGEKVGDNIATKQNINPDQDVSEGVGEAAVAGLAVGKVMGGTMAAVAGRRAPGPVPPTQAAPIPSEAAPPAPPSSTPLTAAVEDVAEEPQRVVLTTPDEQSMGATVKAYQEDDQGGYSAQVVGDDGQVYTITDQDGVQITPVAAAPSGPLSSAVEQVAAQVPDAAPAAPAPAPETAPAPRKNDELPALPPLAPDATPEQQQDWAVREQAARETVPAKPGTADAAPAAEPVPRTDGTTETAAEGMKIIHGSGNDAMTADDVEIVRNAGQKQAKNAKNGKKASRFGGFYGTSEADIKHAEGYAGMMDGAPTLYDIAVKKGTKILNKKGDVTRLKEDYIKELVSQGYGMVVGKDPRGRTEYVVIDKSAIETMSKRGAAPAAPAAPATPAAGEPAAIADMSDAQLRERMKYIASQAKTNGWDKRMVEAKREIEREINTRAAAAPVTEPKEAKDVRPSGDAGNVVDVGGRSDRGTDRDGAAVGNGPVPAGSDGRGGAATTTAVARPDEQQLPTGDVDATQPAVDAAPVKDEHAGKWFSSAEKADAYIEKRKISDTHEQVKTGKVRFEVKPRAAPAPKVSHLEAAEKKHARQEEEIRKANENAAKRAAARAQSEIDAAAQQAATSPTNDLPAPTEAQIEAGNYTKGHVSVQGIDITIENPAGSTRSGKRPDGSTWSHEMSDHYGYIKRTVGADDEHIDSYVGPKPDSGAVFVVDQMDQQTGKFDEHKVMLGFGSLAAATKAYASNFDKGWKVGPVTEMSVDEFKTWLKEGDTSRPASTRSSSKWVNEGKSAADIQQDKVDGIAVDLSHTVREEVQEADFDPAELPAVIKMWSADNKVPEESLRDAVLADINKSKMPAAMKAKITKALKPEGLQPRKPSAKAIAKERTRQIAEHFTPGNIVKGYGGYDRVISFQPATEENGYRMSVRVQAVVKQGDDWVNEPKSDERNHSTIPSDKDLKAGPVLLAPAEEKVPDVALAESAPARAKPAAKAPPSPQEASAPAAGIADFGAKLEGARKDLWAGYKRDMSADLPDDVKEITVAKHFPEPNYEALIAEGVDVKALAALKAMRDEIPAKPRMPYKVRAWGEKVKALREFANKLLDGTHTADEIMAKMRGAGALRKFADRIEMYADLGYPAFTKAKDFTIDSGSYTMFGGKQYSPGIVKYSLEKDGRTVSYFDTREQAVEALRGQLSEAPATAAGAREVKLDMYRLSNGEIVIGKKVAAGKYIDLKGGFTDVKTAREYLRDNRDELVKVLEAKKDVRPERRSVNTPRVGEDRRMGGDITPEKFGETFGFRGVQFGNYVEQKRRAVDLNNAYDALMDMAELLGIPPKAISLTGSLGLAFGARGAGGKNSAAAHYEPGNIVINLTKTQGAGSLAHEWFHAVDNYFERARGGTGSGFITDKPTVRKIPNADRTLRDDDSVRPEVLDAFKAVMSAIKASGMPKRSGRLDARRTKDYWSTGIEMAARAFESYVIDKAAEQGRSNDYLANIVSEEAHDALNDMTNMDEPFPYPTRAEAPAINEAFDKLFSTLKTKDEGGKTALYSVAASEIGVAWPDDTEAGQNPAAITAFVKARAAQAFITAEDNADGSYSITESGLPADMQGQGTGVQLYEALLDELFKRGQRVTSDASVSSKAQQIYKALERRGYAVTQSPDAAVDEETGALEAGGPVYTIGHKAAAKSVGARAGAPLTTATLRDAVTNGALGPVVSSLIDAGLVVLHANSSTLPRAAGHNVADIQAVTMPDGTVHLVAAGLNAGNARAVMLHEAFHQGAKALIGTPAWDGLMRHAGALYRQSEKSTGKAKEFFDKARQRVFDASNKGAVETRMEVEEFAAYAIEEYESAPKTVQTWIDDLIGAVKAWALKRFGAQLGALTPAQLSALAKMAVLDVAATRRGEVFGKSGNLFSVAGKTTSEAFKRWFGNSVVVDASGDPALAVHYTVADFNAFDHEAQEKARRSGAGYTTSYGRDLVFPNTGFFFFVGDAPPAMKSGAKKVAAYLSISNPLDLTKHIAAADVSAIIDHMQAKLNTPPTLGQHGFKVSGKHLGGFREARRNGVSPQQLWDFLNDITGNARGKLWDELLALLGKDGLIMHANSSGTSMLEGLRGRGDGKTYLVAVALRPEQIKSATENVGDFDPANADIRYSVAGSTTAPAPASAATAGAAQQILPPGFTPPDQGWIRRLQATIQDGQNRVRQVQDQIEKLTGTLIRQGSDYYLAETNRPGRIAARNEDAEKQLFKPLMERLAKAGNTPEQLGELLHAAHAQERNEHIAQFNQDMPDGGSGMMTPAAAATLTRYAGPEFYELRVIAQQAREVARATLDMKLAYQLIDSETHDQLTTYYSNYVPLKGDGQYGPKVKRAIGHEAREEHILENISRDHKQAIIVGEKNLARQSLLRMVLQFADPELWTVGVPPKGKRIAGQVFNVVDVGPGAPANGTTVGSFTSRAQVYAFLEGLGGAARNNYKVLDSAGESVVEFVRPLQDNEVIVYIKGDPVRVQIKDEVLAAQLRPLNQEQMNIVGRAAQQLNRYFSRIYTGYNPAFILRNVARDSMTGTVNMMGRYGSVTAAKAWTHYIPAAASLAWWASTGKVPQTETGKMLTEYRMHGGKVGASWMGDLEQQGKELTSMFDDARGLLATAKTGSARRTAAVAWNKSIGRLAHVVEIMNQATENALRLSLFIEMRNQGKTPAIAAQAAKTVTVDFDRKGTATGALGATYLFFNPAVQGAANGIKTLAHGKHKEQAWAAVGGLTVLGAYLASQGMDDDEDRWLGESWNVRSKNFILNVGSHQIRIPISQEFAPAYALGMAAMEAKRGQKTSTSALRVVSSFLDAYFPFRGAYEVDSDSPAAGFAMAFVPTAIKLPVESAFNRNSFGSPIVPESPFTKDRPDNLKMNRGTKNTPFDGTAQGIASFGEMMGFGKYENDITKVSPETLKLMWQTYTGGLGTFITDTGGLAAMSLDAPDEIGTSKVPFVKDFVRNHDIKAIRGRFYELTRESRQTIAEFEAAKKAGDDEAMNKIDGNAAKATLLSLGKMVRSTIKSANELRDEAVDINADVKLTNQEKRDLLKKLEAEEEALYRDGIKAFKE